MKKLVPIISVISLLFTVAACSSGGAGGGDSGPEAPEVMEASELPSFSGTVPADEADALALFNGAIYSFQNALDDDGIEESRLKGRATVPFEDTISWHETNYNGDGTGTIDITGTISGSTTMPDDDFSPQPNTSYNNLVRMLLNMNVEGELGAVTFHNYYDGHEYTISGEMIMNVDIDLNIDFITSSSDYDVNMDFSYEQEYGVAYSVSRDDGAGAKFVITFAAEIDESNIDMTTFDEEEGFDAAFAELQNETATLTVYDNSNNIVHEMEVPLSELEGTLSLLGGI
jgi:hypothetical protein